MCDLRRQDEKKIYKPESRGGDAPYTEALALGETIPPQDGFWVNSQPLDARLRFNSSAY